MKKIIYDVLLSIVLGEIAIMIRLSYGRFVIRMMSPDERNRIYENEAKTSFKSTSDEIKNLLVYAFIEEVQFRLFPWILAYAAITWLCVFAKGGAIGFSWHCIICFVLCLPIQAIFGLAHGDHSRAFLKLQGVGGVIYLLYFAIAYFLLGDSTYSLITVFFFTTLVHALFNFISPRMYKGTANIKLK